MADPSHLRLVGSAAAADAEVETLNLVFAALADPVRRKILDRLDASDLLVGEVAADFDISLQAVSRHIQVLVRAGLVRQERSGRINRCRFDAAPLYDATVWLNRYSKYWQEQFDLLAVSLEDLVREDDGSGKGRAKHPRRRPSQVKSKHAVARSRHRRAHKPGVKT